MIPSKGKPLRLSGIRIHGYRGFPHAVGIKLTSSGGNGRSLLLYGENGSGKSSLGKAVRDFLNTRHDAVEFDDFRYRHSKPPDPARSVTLIFDDTSESDLVWNPNGRDTKHRQFHDMARACGWLDYRVVWRASEVQWGDSAEIFERLVGEILPACQRGASSETFGQTWGQIISLKGSSPTRTNYGRHLVEELERKIEAFNQSLEAFLPELQEEANRLLAEFTPWTSMELEWKRGAQYNSSARRNKFSRGSIRLRMRDRDGESLKKPAEFLNEARITAIGLCVYLAGMARSVPPRRSDGSTYPRILLLDDVLLSLDMTHRLPLLKVLREQFKDWQILLLTHDRAWYEIANQQLENWSHQELFTQRVGDYEQPMLRQDQDHLYTALEFLDQGFIRAAAVYLRTKFELVLQSGCHRLGLPVKYNRDPRKIPASDFWAALKSATDHWDPNPEWITDSRGHSRWYQPKKPQKHRVVPRELEKRIEHAVSWILNPLSHAQTVDRYRAEIEEAIYAVDELDQAVRKALWLRDKRPHFVHQMLISVLRARMACSPSEPEST